MTRVIYDSENLSLTVTGHAGSAEYGSDLVCAALSVLCYTVEEALEQEWEITVPTVDRADGEIRISCQCEEEWSERCRCIMDTAFTGFRILAEHYPEYVSAEEVGGDWRM